jgi:hypothetical protein
MKLNDVLHILKRFKSPLPPFFKGGIVNPLYPADLARTFYKDFTFYLQGFCNTEIYVKQTLDIIIGKFED